jgi:hypothetical protein
VSNMSADYQAVSARLDTLSAQRGFSRQGVRSRLRGGFGFSMPEPLDPPTHRVLELLTPTLPGAGGRREQAVWAARCAVVGVAERATVVSVVVKTVVNAPYDHIGGDGDFGRCQGSNPGPTD